MSRAVDSPLVFLLEDRPKQSMIFQLNLSVYLDARVSVAADSRELEKLLRGPDRPDLVIARAQAQKGCALETLLSLAQKPPGIPWFLLGDSVSRPGITSLPGENEVKPMVQAAAKALGITAQFMVSKERRESFAISSGFLSLLFRFPCDVFRLGREPPEKLFSEGDAVDHSALEALRASGERLGIRSVKRLDLANAVTEQALQAARDLLNLDLPPERKIGLLSSSLDIISAQFRSSGMDEETIQLAAASIQAITEIADKSTAAGALLLRLIEARPSYRYAHCQIVTFLAFHVIRVMGWWGDDQRSVLAQAAFYHDICLSSDHQARVRSEQALREAGNRFSPEQREAALSHAQAAARELQLSGDISPEVVQVVLEHHGSPVGRGYASEIAELGLLSKAFLLAEEWADHLIDAAEHGHALKAAQRTAELKARYRDETSGQIAEALSFIDPEKFAYDLLSTKELDLALERFSGSEPGKETVTRIENTTWKIDTGSALVRGAGAQAGEEAAVRIRGTTEKIGGGEETRISGVTEHRSDSPQLIAGGPDPGSGRGDSIVIKGIPPGKDAAQETIRLKTEDPKEKEKELKLKALDGSTELMKDALRGKIEQIRETLNSSKGEIRKKDAEGRTVLHYAAMGGSIEVMKLLLANGAQVNLGDSKRRSPLFLAALYQRTEAFDFLLSQGAKASQQALGGMTIAMVAASCGNMHLLKQALANGVRADSRDHQGKTALDLAKQRNHVEAVAFLEELTRGKGAPGSSPDIR